MSARTVKMCVVSCIVGYGSAVCWYHVYQKLTALCSSDTLVASCKSKLCDDKGGHSMYTRVLCVIVIGLTLHLTQYGLSFFSVLAT